MTIVDKGTEGTYPGSLCWHFMLASILGEFESCTGKNVILSTPGMYTWGVRNRLKHRESKKWKNKKDIFARVEIAVDYHTLNK